MTLNNQNNLFSEIELKQELLQGLEDLNYVKMTDVQKQSIPYILEKKDVIVEAQTGSGKTAAFGLGLLNQLDVKVFRLQSLILCPTRELADQVANELRKLAKKIHNVKILTICGGMPYGPQISSLKHGAHVIVGTPGRVHDHLLKERINFSSIKNFILDEADRMLEMGFKDTIDDLIEKLPDGRQNLLFSATYPKEISQISNHIMKEPILIKVKPPSSKTNITQKFYKVKNDEDKIPLISSLLSTHKPESCIIFCNTKKRVKQLEELIKKESFITKSLHGDLEQKDRNQVLVQFLNKSVTVLIATDVAARGIDVNNLDLVVNFDLPFDSSVYTHRIGRTGRAGNNGLACSLISDNDLQKIIFLEDLLGITIDLLESDFSKFYVYKPKFNTIQINAGKKQKIRAGDILGALTNHPDINGEDIGLINIFDNTSYVAIKLSKSNKAVKKITTDKLKGRSFRARLIR